MEKKIEEKDNIVINVEEVKSNAKNLITNPIDYLSGDIDYISDLKKSSIVALIISVIATFIALLIKVYTIVKLDYEVFNSNGKLTSWYFENLDNYNMLNIVGNYFVTFIGFIFIIAAVFYMASLIVKKEINFGKTVGITSMALIPAYVMVLIIAPILGKLYYPLAIIAIVKGIAFSSITIFKVLNDKMKLNSQQFLYVNIAVSVVIAIASYFLILNVILTEISGFMNVFGF